MATRVFIQLPVSDLGRATAFLGALGFATDPGWTDAASRCMIAGTNIYVVLMLRGRFATFTPCPVADARSATEVLVCLDCAHRDEVDRLAGCALAAGGRAIRPPEDHGFMYGRAFQDPDGHIWELVWLSRPGVPA